VTTATVEAALDLRAVWRRWRLPLVMALLVVGAALVLAALENAPAERPLDPGDASPAGGRALAELLRDRGIAVTAAATVGDVQLVPGVTVLIPDPGSLTSQSLQEIADSPVDLVVIAPNERQLRALRLGDIDVTPSSSLSSTVRPECNLELAQRAGSISFAGAGLLASPPAVGCYPSRGGAGLVHLTRNGATTVVFGSTETFSNERLDEQGDAALALSLLSRNRELSWLVPRPPTRAPAEGRNRGLFELLPSRLLWATLQLFVVVVLVALWRGRRLGAVVEEPLPVVVRATETVEGRARLLRAARARATAAAALRDAAGSRLRDVLGIGADAEPTAVVSAVAARTRRPGAAVEALLYGAEPSDDAGLLALADELDELEASVRRT